MSKWNEPRILIELDKIVKSDSKFPTHQRLMELKRGDLRNAIILSGKKINYYAEQLGITPKTRHRDFWNHTTVQEALTKMCNELGYFPTQKEMVKMGYTDLHLAMWRNGESIQHWQKLLGYEPKVKPAGYWRNEDNIIKDFMEFVDIYDFYPTQMALRENGRHDLARAIDRSGKGLAYFQKLAGLEPPFYEASDGHFLDSSYELVLDEWLYSQGIKHDVHGYINRERSRCRYDFKIGDTYVEIWGYAKDNTFPIAVEYNEKRKLKEHLYAELGLKMISLEASFFAGSSGTVISRIAETFGAVPA